MTEQREEAGNAVGVTGLLLKTSPEVSRAEAENLVTELVGDGWPLAPSTSVLDWLEFESDDGPVSVGDGFDAIRRLRAHPGVIAVEPILDGEAYFPDEVDEQAARAVRAAPVDPDTEGKFDWHLVQVKAQQAWEYANTRGEGIRIASVDTGYTEHPELVSGDNVRADLGYNFREGTDSPQEPLKTIKQGHGTATGSVLISPPGRQLGGTSIAVWGVAPDAEVVPIRVDKNVWFWSGARDAKGVLHAVSNGCDVISMSRGGRKSAVLFEAARHAVEQGVIVVAAAGNCNLSCKIRDPARYPHVACAAGSTYSRRPWQKSSHGAAASIGAPAASVYRARATKKNRRYEYENQRSSGTSYATPIVAGAAAIWLAHHGGRVALAGKLGGVARAIPAVFLHLLRTEAYSAGVDWDASRYGPGILDVEALVRAELPDRATTERLVAELDEAMGRSARSAGAYASDVRTRDLRALFGDASARSVAVSDDLAEELSVYLLLPEVREALSAARAGTRATGVREARAVEAILSQAPSEVLARALRAQIP